MGKIKVRDLASKYSISTKELLNALQRAGFRAVSASSLVDEAKARPFLPAKETQSAASISPSVVRVKKYENRRLYSTTHSRHLTLEELAELVRAGQIIEVTDAGDGRELTSEILMQILIEEGRAKEMPSTLLAQMIRLQDEAMKSEMSRWLGTLFEFYSLTGREMARAYAQMSPMRLFSPWSWSPPEAVEQKLDKRRKRDSLKGTQ